jgi:DNA primase
MPRYTDESKRRVRDAVDMVELVTARVPELRRVNADSYVGLCPFHDERSPSFSVKPSEKLYYCFGCQASGDAFDFVRETQSLDFVGALEYLADRYRVTLEVVEEDPRAAERRRREDRLYALLDRTCTYYERTLWDSDEGARAREYLAGRGLSEEMLREFRVGFAPSPYDRVLNASRRAGFSEAELLAAGLVQRSSQRPGSVYDRFRRRITFPLCDVRGRVLGFGARGITEADRPKYLNTADGPVYHKGRQLFGAHLARSQAAKAGSVILCEGYTDVIAAHQAGVRNCVGLMGTALTDEQVAVLRGFATTIVLALDADSAGQDAMLKAARVEADPRVDLRVCVLPAGADPADVLASDGAEAVRTMLGTSTPFVRFRVERILDGGDASTPEGRDRILSELRAVFDRQLPPAMREQLEREIVGRLGLPESVVRRVLSGGPSAPGADPLAELALSKLTAIERTERTFLELCIALPDQGGEMLARLDLDHMFGSPLARAAAEHLRSRPGADAEDPPLATLLRELTVRAAALAPVPAELAVERQQLELARVERAMASARGDDPARLSRLGHERDTVKRELDQLLDRVLVEKAAARV